ncbi:hypothetical protein J2W56_003609 [Nocardia kruczakiae]|uniref:Uncharacterized protein n=1 Tax=Nocardia kruczakiae TaxID=261477 RepID=A0ABU1XH41_9NOCA|nr:hypothetical protein [Nocardia kruczakiae]
MASRSGRRGERVRLIRDRLGACVLRRAPKLIALTAGWGVRCRAITSPTVVERLFAAAQNAGKSLAVAPAASVFMS